MFSMTVKVNDRVLRQHLDEFIARGKDLRPVWDKVGEGFVTEFRNNFPAEGERIGEKWAKLKPSTLAQKERMGFGGFPILVRTGKLLNSIKVLDLGNLFVKIGTTVDYAAYHQEGTRGMSARKIIGLPTKYKDKISEMIGEYLIKAFGSL